MKAAQFAKVLVGAFPNARPPDPAGYIASIAATLAQYPEGVAAECADPRTGIARTFRYQAPNVVDIIEWCDGRMKAHRGAAAHRLELPPPPVSEETKNRVLSFWNSLKDRFLAAAAAEPAHEKIEREIRDTRREGIIGRRWSLPDVPTDEELRRRYPQAQEGV